MSIPWGDIATYATAGTSAVIALGAWRSAARSADEAKRSADTAENVAVIERARWHFELTPVFKVKLQKQGGDRAALDFQLVGPLNLLSLDQIEISIVSSDDLVRTDQLAGSRPQVELDAQVWGPYRLVPGSDGADANGQTVHSLALSVGRGQPFALERTRPPHWQVGQDSVQRWAEQWSGKPVRLVIRCHKDGFAPWVVPCDVEMPPRAPWVP